MFYYVFINILTSKIHTFKLYLFNNIIYILYIYKNSGHIESYVIIICEQIL